MIVAVGVAPIATVDDLLAQLETDEAELADDDRARQPTSFALTAPLAP